MIAVSNIVFGSILKITQYARVQTRIVAFVANVVTIRKITPLFDGKSKVVNETNERFPSWQAFFHGVLIARTTARSTTRSSCFTITTRRTLACLFLVVSHPVTSKNAQRIDIHFTVSLSRYDPLSQRQS